MGQLHKERILNRRPLRIVKLGHPSFEDGRHLPSLTWMSVIVTVFDTGLPALTPDGKLAVFTATVKARRLRPHRSWW